MSIMFTFFSVFWNVYGECDNFAVLTGHTNAITDMHYSTDGAVLYTASADKTVMCWDTVSGTRVKKLRGQFVVAYTTVRLCSNPFKFVNYNHHAILPAVYPGAYALYDNTVHHVVFP